MLKRIALLTALLALPSLAEASIVDPRRVTLRALMERSSAAVIAEVRQGPGGLEFVLVEDVKGASPKLQPLPITDRRLSERTRAGQRGLLFLSPGKGALAPMDVDDRAWIPNDAGALAFVEQYRVKRSSSPEAVARLLLTHIDSGSPRVRQDVLWDLCSFLPQLARFNEAELDRVARASRAAWDRPASGAAPMVLLGALPGGRGLPDLAEAARKGIKPRAVGRALAAHGAALDALASELQESDGGAEEKTKLIAVLGYSGRPRAVPALLTVLGDAGLAVPAARALANIPGDRRAVPALKALLLGAERDRELLAWAAVGLAFRADDASLGALGFARYNHPDPAMKRFLTRLVKDPAQARRALQRSGFKAVAPARRR